MFWCSCRICDLWLAPPFFQSPVVGCVSLYGCLWPCVTSCDCMWLCVAVPGCVLLCITLRYAYGTHMENERMTSFWIYEIIKQVNVQFNRFRQSMTDGGIFEHA